VGQKRQVNSADDMPGQPRIAAEAAHGAALVGADGQSFGSINLAASKRVENPLRV
jgi:hypothetical protein